MSSHIVDMHAFDFNASTIVSSFSYIHTYYDYFYHAYQSREC